MLKIADLVAGYGRIRILDQVNLELHAGEIAVIAGPNGAGKTTLLNAISNIVTIFSGAITFRDRTLHTLRPHEIVHAGIAHCPEGRRILSRLTVEENLKAGCIERKRKFEEKRDEVFAMFPILADRRHTSAQRMSGGQQQMLAIARSLMSEPDVILLDEPSLGLAPKLVTQIFESVLQLARTGISIILVEQNVRLAMEIGDYAYLMESGRFKLEGHCQEIQSDPGLAGVYLGHEAGTATRPH